MKKLSLFTFGILSLLMVGCYDDYVKDYDKSGIYIAYQYDLRTFIVGEGMNFDVGAVLGGVIENKSDRNVSFAVEPDLVTADLSLFDPEAEDSFTAFEVMSGASSSGVVSQSYVTDAVKESGITALTPLPEDCFSLSDAERMTIRAGRHTGTITVQADSLAFLSDPNVSTAPYYALAFRIREADADIVLLSKSFAVIAVRYENMLFGNWWHGGVTTVRDDVTGNEVEKSVYPTVKTTAQSQNRVYELTTVAPDALLTSRLGNGEGTLRLTLDGGEITVNDAAGSLQIEPFGDGCSFNRAKLLQNRQLYLNYKYSNGDGTTTYVQDTLSFRNRIHDGVNEWQDENPEHYK